MLAKTNHHQDTSQVVDVRFGIAVPVRTLAPTRATEVTIQLTR